MKLYKTVLLSLSLVLIAPFSAFSVIPGPAQPVQPVGDAPLTTALRLQQVVNWIESVQRAAQLARDANLMLKRLDEAYQGIAEGSWDGFLQAQSAATEAMGSFNDALYTASYFDDQEQAGGFFDSPEYGQLAATTQAMERSMQSQRRVLMASDRMYEWTQVSIERAEDIMRRRQDANLYREHLRLNGEALDNLDRQLLAMHQTVSTYISHEAAMAQNEEWLEEQERENYRDMIDISDAELEQMEWEGTSRDEYERALYPTQEEIAARRERMSGINFRGRR